MSAAAALCDHCQRPPCCPHCGTDFTRMPRIVERDGWRISDRWAEYRDEGKIALTPAEASALRSIAVSPGVLHVDAIANRAGYSDDPGNTTRNLVCRLRSKLGEGLIVNVFGAGYRWGGQTARCGNAVEGATEAERRALGTEAERRALGTDAPCEGN